MGNKQARIAGLTAEIESLRRVNATLVDRLLDLAGKPPVVIQPPDTSEIIKAVAELVNGWRTVADTQPVPQLGFDDTVDRERIEEFVPPWEQMGDVVARAGWINPPNNGAYTPYVPGAGNVVPPEGGVE